MRLVGGMLPVAGTPVAGTPEAPPALPERSTSVMEVSQVAEQRHQRARLRRGSITLLGLGGNKASACFRRAQDPQGA